MTKTFIRASLRGVWAIAFFAVFLLIAASNDHFFSSAQKSGRDNAVLAGTISGKVFHDYNSNGVFDNTSGLNSIDAGVSGVTRHRL